jgi:hypothetical protein
MSKLGNASVIKENANPSAITFVGVADNSLPVNGKSTVKIQSGTGNFTPDYWEAAYKTPTYVVLNHSKQINGSINVGQINMLDGMGVTFDNTTFAADTMGYDGIELALVAQNNQGGSFIAWSIWGVGPKLASHGVPHLPAAVKVADVTGGASPDARVYAAKFEGGSASPWSEYAKHMETLVIKDIGTIDPGNRP